MLHDTPHPLAGQTVLIQPKGDDGPPLEYRVEDWADRVLGMSWTRADGNFAAINYAMRAGMNRIPVDDEVMYGKVGDFGHLIHMSEVLPE